MNPISKPKHRTRIPANLANCSYPELLAMKEQLDRELAGIKLQFARARTTLAETGEHADPGWLARARYAQQLKGAGLQVIQNELSRRKREKPSGNLDTYFLLVARRRLKDEVFADILQEAKDLFHSSVSPEGHSMAR